MNIEEFVEADPERMGGTPRFAGACAFRSRTFSTISRRETVWKHFLTIFPRSAASKRKAYSKRRGSFY